MDALDSRGPFMNRNAFYQVAWHVVLQTLVQVVHSELFKCPKVEDLMAYEVVLFHEVVVELFGLSNSAVAVDHLLLEPQGFG